MNTSFSFGTGDQSKSHGRQDLNQISDRIRISKQKQTIETNNNNNNTKGVLSKIILQNKLPILAKDYSSIKKINFNQQPQHKSIETQSKSSEFVFQSQNNSMCPSQSYQPSSCQQVILEDNCDRGDKLLNNGQSINEHIFTFQPSSSTHSESSVQIRPSISTKTKEIDNCHQTNSNKQETDNKNIPVPNDLLTQKPQQNRSIKIMQHLQRQYQNYHQQFIQQIAYKNNPQTYINNNNNNPMQRQIIKRSMNKFEVLSFDVRKYSQIQQNAVYNQNNNNNKTRKNTKKLSSSIQNNNSFKSRQDGKQQKSTKTLQKNRRTQIKQFLTKIEQQKHNIFKLIPIKLWVKDKKQQHNPFQSTIMNQFTNEIAQPDHRLNKFNQQSSFNENNTIDNIDNNEDYIKIDKVRLQQIYIKQRELTQKFTVHETTQFIQCANNQNQRQSQFELSQHIRQIFIKKFINNIQPKPNTIQNQFTQTYNNKNINKSEKNPHKLPKINKIKKHPQIISTTRMLKMIDIRMIQYSTAMQIINNKITHDYNNKMGRSEKNRQLYMLDDMKQSMQKQMQQKIIDRSTNQTKDIKQQQISYENNTNKTRQMFIKQYQQYFNKQCQQLILIPSNNNNNNNNNNSANSDYFTKIANSIHQKFTNNYNKCMAKMISSRISGRMIYEVQSQIVEVRKKQQVWLKMAFGIVKQRNRNINNINNNNSNNNNNVNYDKGNRNRNVYVRSNLNSNENINNSYGNNAIFRNQNDQYYHQQYQSHQHQFRDSILINNHNNNPNNNKNRKKLPIQQNQAPILRNYYQTMPSTLQIMKKIKPTNPSGSAIIVNKPTNYSNLNSNHTNSNINRYISSSLTSSLANSSVRANQSGGYFYQDSREMYHQYGQNNNKNGNRNRKQDVMEQKKVELQQYIDNLCQNQNISIPTKYNCRPNNNYYNNSNKNLNLNSGNNSNSHNNYQSQLNLNSNITKNGNNRYIKYSKYPMKFTTAVEFNSGNPQDCTIVYNLQQIQIKELTLKFIADRRRFGVNFVKIKYKGNLQQDNLNQEKERRKNYREQNDEDYYQQTNTNKNNNTNNTNKWKLIKIMQMLHCLGAKVIVQQHTNYQIMEDKYDATVEMLAFVLRANVQQVWQQYTMNK